MPKVDRPRDRRAWGNVARKNPAVEGDSGKFPFGNSSKNRPNEAKSETITAVINPSLSLADCIAVCELRLADFKAQQRKALLYAIADVYPGEVFSASQLWQQPVLRAAFIEARIENVKQLGRWLQQAGADRIGRDERGVVWTAVSENDLHDEAGIDDDDDV
jgi:hypothetical protein